MSLVVLRWIQSEYALMIKLVDGTSSAHSFNPDAYFGHSWSHFDIQNLRLVILYLFPWIMMWYLCHAMSIRIRYLLFMETIMIPLSYNEQMQNSLFSWTFLCHLFHVLKECQVAYCPGYHFGINITNMSDIRKLIFINTFRSLDCTLVSYSVAYFKDNIMIPM